MVKPIWNGQWYVYALIDQRTKKPFYIGITTDWDGRKRTHLDNPCVQALCEPMPTMECIRIIEDEKTARRFERYLIRKLPDLVNVAGVPSKRERKQVLVPKLVSLAPITPTYQIVIKEIP